MTVGPPIPALPVSDTQTSTLFYRERLGFTVVHADEGFVIVSRDRCVLHLWLADDSGWRHRPGFDSSPIVSGAEDFLAGTASCRIEVTGEGALDALFLEMRAAQALHRVSRSGVAQTDYGMREVHVSDPDGNLLSFFERI